MFQPTMSNSTTTTTTTPHQQQPKLKRKRNHPGNPDPDAEVIALSPKTLMTTNRFVCEICSKGFQRDQNLQLHRRGHNLPWKLRHKGGKEAQRKKVYVCPEPSCVHNHPSRALGDLTGIKKHYCRKHGEKLWRCDKCSKKYAVMSDWKAHVKTCGTREYKCDCGTLFSRKDSFLTHRAFCDALAEETARLSAAAAAEAATATLTTTPQVLFPFPWNQLSNPNPNYPLPRKFTDNTTTNPTTTNSLPLATLFPALSTTMSNDNAVATATPELSATALLQKASCMGCMATSTSACPVLLPTWQPTRLTRDFLGGGFTALPSVGEGELLREMCGLDSVPATCQQGSAPTSAFQSHAWGGY